VKSKRPTTRLLFAKKYAAGEKGWKKGAAGNFF